MKGEDQLSPIEYKGGILKIDCQLTADEGRRRGRNIKKPRRGIR